MSVPTKEIAEQQDKPTDIQASPNRKRRWLKRLLRLAIVAVALVGAAFVYARHCMNQWDVQHSEFLEVGKSINEFMKQYASAIADSVEEGSSLSVVAHYANSYTSPARGTWTLGDGRDIGDVQYYELTAIDEKTYGLSDIRSEVTSYLSNIASIDRAKCKINLIEEIDPSQDAATFTVNYIVDGTDKAGQVFQDRFRLRWWIRRDDKNAKWNIVRDELVHGVRNAGNGASFETLAAIDSGIDYVHRRDPKLDASDPTIQLKFAVIEHAEGGVSASDYDADGDVDLFFPDGVESRLYRNNGTESSRLQFDDQTQEAGLAGIDQAHCGLFADFDNDGDQDLFVTRYLAPSKLFTNNADGTFTDATESFGLNVTQPCVSACLLDFDNDGFLDIYIAVNGNAFESCPNVPFYATNGEPNILLRNMEGKGFEDVSDQSGTANIGWTLAVTAGDYNADGRTDLLLANDFGRKVLYHNNGDGTFKDVTKKAKILDFSGGMGVAFGDFTDDGIQDVYTSNINSNQRWFGEDLTIKQYMNNVIRTKWIWREMPIYSEIYGLLGSKWSELGKMVGEGNSLFANQGDGTFLELKDSRTRRAGWGWCVGFFDADNDADLDLFAANGWISGENKDDL